MKPLWLSLMIGLFLLIPLASRSVPGQTKADYCHVYLMDINAVLKAEEKPVPFNAEEANRLLLAGKTVNGLTILGRFTPLIQEEALTTKNYPLPGMSMFVTASVYYTDESMFSTLTKVADSVLVGIVVTNKQQDSAFEVLRCASVEATYNDYTDTLRQKTRFESKGRAYLVGVECRCRREWDELDPKAKKQ